MRALTATLPAIALGVALASSASGAARTCDEYVALRVGRLEMGASQAVRACLRRVANHGGLCPDSRLDARLAHLRSSGVRAIARRCPGTNGDAILAAAEADVLCELLAMCPLPTPRPSATPPPADPPVPHLDAGWVGISHGLAVPDAAQATGELSGCNGVADAICNLHAATTGTSFGAPLPATAGGIPTCLTFAFDSDMTGTFDPATGALTESSVLRIAYYLGDDLDVPCPVCAPADGDPELGEAGTCQQGPNAGGACTIDGLAYPGYGPGRATSSDCPPDPAKRIGEFGSAVSATTGTTSFGTTADSPRCGASAPARCLCDTCNTAETIACASNADCPESGGAPGICGGRRCLGGANVGMPCTSSSQCSFAACGRPGEPTRPDTCNDDDEAPSQPLCHPLTTEQGECVFGPVNTVCAQQPHRFCVSDDDCRPPNGNVPGDVCESKQRPCFLEPIVATGTPDVAVDSVAHPLLAATLCIPPTERAAQNAVSGLPGPARIVWPLALTLQP